MLRLQSANMIKKLQLRVFVFLISILVPSVVGKNCDTFSSPYYLCNKQKPEETCTAYAFLRANSHYSSLSNMTSYFGILPSDLAEANAYAKSADFLSESQPVLVPIECKCTHGGFFEAEVTKTSGDSLYEIAESLEGLTSCNAIREKNPNLEDKTEVLVPLKCACPFSDDPTGILASYPVKEGDTLAELGVEFDVSAESLKLTNERHSRSLYLKAEDELAPASTILIPLPATVVVRKLQDHHPVQSREKKRRKRKKRMIGVYVGVALVGFAACVGIATALLFIYWWKKKKSLRNDVEQQQQQQQQQQLSLSIRTTSDKKVSFEGSQYNFDEHSIYTSTPHKMRVESYTFEDLQKASQDFCSGNLIQSSVFHGRHKGKNLAIKRVKSGVMSKIDTQIFQHNPNVVRLLGTCVMDGPDSFLVLEYARNGCLKDWIHGGLAIKSQFIASCSCFLSWNQRLKICLDVATALHHMHHIMNPSYVHGNITSRNVYLDEDFNAKLGMPKLSDDKEEKGYMAPEGTISPRTDIFTYGVVLLEVLSGKPPATLCDEIKQILQSEDAEKLKGWMDGGLGESYSFDGAVKLANIARSCVEEDPSSRPNAGEIMDKLLRLVEESPVGDDYNMCESSSRPLVL